MAGEFIPVPRTPDTVADRGAVKNALASAATNKSVIQAAITDAHTESGAPVVFGPGRYYIDAGLATSSRRTGIKFQGSGGLGYWDSTNGSASTTELVQADSDQYSAPGTLPTPTPPDTNTLKTPFLILNGAGDCISDIQFFGREPEVAYNSGDRTEVLVQIAAASGTPAQGKHSFERCYFRHGGVMMLFGSLDGTSVDNSDHTSYYHCRFDGGSSVFFLNNQQSRDIRIYSASFRQCERVVDIARGGVVGINGSSLIQAGGTLFYVRDGPGTGDGNELITANDFIVDAVGAPTFPLMLVNTESGSSNHFQAFYFSNLAMHGDPHLRMGVNKDGGPGAILRGAQKLYIEGATGLYRQMIQCHAHSSGNVPQIFVNDITFDTGEASVNMGPVALVEPTTGSDGYQMFARGWGLRQLSGSGNISKQQNVYVRNSGGVSTETYPDGTVLYRYAVRVYPIATNHAVADPLATFSAPVTGNFSGIYMAADAAGSGSELSVNMRNASNGDAVMLSTPVTIDSGDTHTDQADLAYAINGGNAGVTVGHTLELYSTSIHTTPGKGLTIWVEFTPS